MPLLNQDQIAERIALYKRYSDAITHFEGISNAMPEEPPERLVVTWGVTPGRFTEAEEAEEAEYAPRQRTRFVVQRAWKALRTAVIADVLKEIDDAEAAVRLFEAGEEVTAGAVNNASE